MKNWVDVSPPAGNIYPLTTPAKRSRQDSTRLPTFGLIFVLTEHSMNCLIPVINRIYTLTDEEHGFRDVVP